MARGNNATSTTKNTDWYGASVNTVALVGKVKRILVSSEKVLKFSLETVQKTKNDKYQHQFITVVTFDPNFDANVDDIVKVEEGHITVSEYNGKYNTEVVADKISK